MTNQELINQLDPSIQPKALAFIRDAAAVGFNLQITSGYRSIEEQNTLYHQGRTTPGKIVTNAKGGESFHNFGLAFDVYDLNKGYDIDWNKLGEIAASVGLEHGDRGYIDLPHFQYRGGLTLQEVQAGQRPKVEILPMDESKSMLDFIVGNCVSYQVADPNPTPITIVFDTSDKHQFVDLLGQDYSKIKYVKHSTNIQFLNDSIDSTQAELDKSRGELAAMTKAKEDAETQLTALKAQLSSLAQATSVIPPAPAKKKTFWQIVFGL